MKRACIMQFRPRARLSILNRAGASIPQARLALRFRSAPDEVGYRLAEQAGIALEKCGIHVGGIDDVRAPRTPFAVVDQAYGGRHIIPDALGGELRGKTDAREEGGVSMRVSFRAIETDAWHSEAEGIDDAVHVAIGERAQKQIASRKALHVNLMRRFGEDLGSRDSRPHDAQEVDVRKAGSGKRKELDLDLRL